MNNLSNELSAGSAIELRALSLPADALPRLDVDTYRIEALDSAAAEQLTSRLDFRGELAEALHHYLFAWKPIPGYDLNDALKRVGRRSLTEDVVDLIALLNIETSQPVTVLAEIMFGAGLTSRWGLESLNVGVTEEGDLYPSMAADYRVPVDMHGYFVRSVAAVQKVRRELHSYAPAEKRLSIALRQFAIANDEMADLPADESWLADSLVRLMVVLEALVGERGGAVTRTLTQRGALLAGQSYEEVQEAAQVISDAYSLRSSYVHGGPNLPSLDTLLRTREVVGGVLRNWMVVMAAWASEAGHPKKSWFLRDLDECLIVPGWRLRMIEDALVRFGETVGHPFGDEDP